MERWRQLGGMGDRGRGGCWRVVGSDCLSIPVCVPPGGTNVSFEQFVDSPLSSWPASIQTGSIFWTLGMPRTSRGHQCVIQMPWLHSHHLLLCSWISGLAFCTRAYPRWSQWSLFAHICIYQTLLSCIVGTNVELEIQITDENAEVTIMWSRNQITR